MRDPIPPEALLEPYPPAIRVWEPGERIDAALATELLHEAAAVARMSRAERLLWNGRSLD